MRAGAILWIGVYVLSTNVFSQKLAGTLHVSNLVQPGYTLFTSLNTKNTYLIDNCGRTINSWQSQYTSGSTAYLMNNGNLLRAVNIPNSIINRAGGGGGIEIMDWDSNILWYFEYNTSLVRQHHDIHPMENGNILVVAWQVRSKEEAIAAGRNPALLPDGVLWSEEIVEVKPIFPDGFEIVWRWSAWDHLVQDRDESKHNYGNVAEHPELIDINYVEGQGSKDWIHINAIDYNAELDQIMLCTPFFDEFWIIDHSTTTGQAATHTGGKSNKGGDLLYRWGNPKTYKRGSDQDVVLGGPHNAHWIKSGLPHEGKVLIFNNNKGDRYSAAEIIIPPQNSPGAYKLEDGRFGPDKASLSVTASPPQNLHSSNMSGVEMQANGNLLLCPSQQGMLVELTSSLDTAWLYKSPITTNGIAGRDFTPADADFKSDPSFRATKYFPDYPGLVGKDLTPGETIEGGGAECPVVTSALDRETFDVHIYPNPVSDFLSVEAPNSGDELDVRIIDAWGRETIRELGHGTLRISTNSLPDGFYITRVNNRSIKIIKRD
jgi:hypothetical protein